MPIYSYRCSTCACSKDVLQKVSDPVLTQCPACGAATFAKQLTAAGFQLKGSGWYASDFKTSSAPTKASSDSSESATASEAPPASGNSGESGPATAAACGASCACH